MSDSGDYTVVISTPTSSTVSQTAVLGVHSKSAPSSVVQFPDALSLDIALSIGQPVTFALDGTILLTHTILIETNTTLDATGRSVALDGASTLRHFVVTNGATLRLINLTLQNGRSAGPVGATNQDGSPGMGGAIFNSGGRLDLTECRLIANQTLGGHGGPTAYVGPFPMIPPTAGGSAFGGAIYCTNGSLVASNCLFAGNSASGGEGSKGDTYTGAGGDAFGGAAFCTNGAVNFTGVIFTNNLAQAGRMSDGRPAGGGGRSYGGGFADAGAATFMTNCTFIANQALGEISAGGDSGSAYAGAYFHDAGRATLAQTLFSSNSVTGSGGISRSYVGNRASDGNGGAILNRAAGVLDLIGCALVFNQANGGTASNIMIGQMGGLSGVGAGGAIYNQGSLSLVNCTVAENNSVGGMGIPGTGVSPGSAFGGFLFNEGGAVSLLNVTVADNAVRVDSLSPSPFPLLAQGSSIFGTNGTVMLANTILSCSSLETNIFGTVTDRGHNLCSDGSAGFTSPASWNNTDPRLGPLANNGGPTPTMALLPGSPAIDAGDESLSPPTDQRGVARPFGSASDIGAFELIPTLSIGRAALSSVQIQYCFEPLKSYALSASTNLIDWVSLGTRTSDTNGVILFTDPISTQQPQRFYRVR
jgi:hypothetical protein